MADAVQALAVQVVRHGAAMGPLVLRAAADASLQKRGNASSALSEESPGPAAVATWFGA